MVLSRPQRRRQADQRSRRLLEGRHGRIVTDRIYLGRALELARRGLGNTAPNPCVGALLVRDGATLGEGFHHARGAAHAEVEALTAAGQRGRDVRGATAYVTLEPCDHTGLTPPCSRALVAAGVARVVIGALDPNPRTAGGGVARLRAAGITVDVVGDPAARDLIEAFSVAVRTTRPYVRLKLASSLDGKLAPSPGPFWLTGEPARRYVRDLRSEHDAVLVGAGTVRTDDPRLTVRPAFARRRPYRRVVACGAGGLAPAARIFAPAEGYAPTIALVPAGRREAFAGLDGVADVVAVGEGSSGRLDIGLALDALKTLGIDSVLCEGGAHLAGALLARRVVDRVDWLVAPRFLSTPVAVPALDGVDLSGLAPFAFDRAERLGDDLLVSTRLPLEA